MVSGGSSGTNWIVFNEQHLNNTIQAMSSKFFVKPSPINLAQTSEMKKKTSYCEQTSKEDTFFEKLNKICNLNVTKSFVKSL